MHTGTGQVVELILKNGLRLARISCHPQLTPSPGQYVFAGTASFSDPLPVPLFSTESTPQGFIASAPIPDSWVPGTELVLHGPIGHGFALPVSAHKVALVAFDDTPARLQGLIEPSLKQGASVVLVCDSDEDDLSQEVEIQPLSSLEDVWGWADYVAVDVSQGNLSVLEKRLNGRNQAPLKKDAQILVRTPVPCGGVAECGACAVMLKSGWKMACKDGPVFGWVEF